MTVMLRILMIIGLLSLSNIAFAADTLDTTIPNFIDKFRSNPTGAEFVALKDAKIRNDTEAKQAALGWQLKHNGLLAEEDLRVVGLYPAGRRVDGLTGKGNWIWEVKIVETSLRLGGIILIDARKGNTFGAVPSNAR